MYGAMLVSYLTDKPFRYFDRIHVKTITPRRSKPSRTGTATTSTWPGSARG